MRLWFEIGGRELAMLAVLLGLGIGPASFLGRRFDAAARLAIAPALGLCLATCVFTTLIWFTAARHTYWLVPVIASVSVATALRRSLGAESDPSNRIRRWWRASRHLGALDALSLLLVCVVVAAPLSYTLHEHNSVGPTGYLIMDADGYTATADGMERLSLREAQRPAAESADFVHKFWHHIASEPWNVDASPLAANVDLLFGLHATDTQSLFLIVFLVTGALGAFAAVRYLLPRPRWAAPLAGALFAGPLFLQLMIDGSQAAICGLAVLMPLAAVSIEAIREYRRANLVLVAVFASGLMALYPLYFPVVALAAAIALFTTALIRLAGGRIARRSLVRAALSVAIVMALTAVFDVVSLTRDLSYWLETAGGEDLSSMPIYHLPLSVLPGWVLQTRQFYVLQTPPLPYLLGLAQAPVVELLGKTILPLILISVIVFGLWHNRRAVALISLVVVFAAIAEYASTTKQCSYCVDRDTLPSAPVGIVLLALGIGALSLSRHRWMRWSAVLVSLATLVAVGAQTWTERQLFATEAYSLNGDERTLLSDLPAHAGPVDLEGFGRNPEMQASIGELPLVYILAYEHNHGQVSLPTEYDEYSGLAYFGGLNTRNPEFSPRYRFLLTRLGGVTSDRRVLDRAGPLALEERTSALDAMVTAGIGFPMVHQESRGLPSVLGDLHFLVVGGGSAPAWIRLRFLTTDPATAVPQPRERSQPRPHELTVCVPAVGAAPVRTAALQLNGTVYPRTSSTSRFAQTEPYQGLTLVAMRATTRCRV